MGLLFKDPASLEVVTREKSFIHRHLCINTRYCRSQNIDVIPKECQAGPITRKTCEHYIYKKIEIAYAK